MTSLRTPPVADLSSNCHRVAGHLQHFPRRVDPMAPTTLSPPPAGRVATTDAPSGPALELTVAGLLDEDAGRALLGAVDDATDGWWRVEVDLRSVSGHTSQGVAAVTKLCRTGSLLPGGIGFSVSAGASRAALLASLADA
jgi:hypothetical protein